MNMPKKQLGSSRVTQHDIANALGISIITVQRAIHKTGYVSPEMAQRILDYIEQVNYQPDLAAQILVRSQSSKRMALFSADSPAYFWDSVAQGVNMAAQRVSLFGWQVQYHRLTANNPDAYLEKLQAEIDSGLNSAALVNHDTFDMQKVFSLLDEHKIPYVTFHIDAPSSNRLGYIGPDYPEEGQLAAEALGKCLLPGSHVGVIRCRPPDQPVPGLNALAESRYQGFVHYISSEFPRLQGVEMAIPFSDSSVMIKHRLTNFFEQSKGQLSAIYCIPPIADEIVQVIQELNLVGRVKVIVAESSPSTHDYLRRNLLAFEIGQNPILQGYFAVMSLAQILAPGDKPEGTGVKIVHDLITKANLDLYSNLSQITRTHPG
jgi:LacI family transcriptional regulator